MTSLPAARRRGSDLTLLVVGVLVRVARLDRHDRTYARLQLHVPAAAEDAAVVDLEAVLLVVDVRLQGEARLA